MRRNSWVKSIVTFGIIIVLIGIMISIYGFIEYCTQKAANQAVEEYKQCQEPEDLVINTTQPCAEGYLTVFDHAGVTHFQYEGEIIIENDGSNGEPINIQIYIPNENPSYQLEEQIYE